MTGRCAPRRADQRPQRGNDGDEPPLQPSRRAHADQLPHQESEIESAGVNQQALPDIRVAAEIYTTHPARFVEVREGSFQALTTQSHQAQAARIPNSVVHEINRVDRFPT